MNKPRHFRIEQLFQQAADLPPEERAAFLEAQCKSQRTIRAEVEALLECMEDERFPSLNIEDPIDAALIKSLGQQIGPYKLVQLLGEGGFGSVFMAEQEEPIRRKVALKIIKMGMDTKQVIARFEMERQALAMMDHPSIAKVFDAGATDTGRPFFVMELVQGIPLTEYCDEYRLSLERRLQLFIKICHAVQHAHRKGIIHRDIKPSNVLVSLHEGMAVPKIIDFGIAKATGMRLTQDTLTTTQSLFVGTLEYMSPEQAVINSTDIDTRTDIYSLGALLYMLLTGRTLFDRKTVGKLSLGEVQRIIREEDPPTPSQRVGTMGPDLPQVARSRRLGPKTLRRTLHGDLDWIVMKALEKKRDRRYESTSELAADVERHLRHEAVLACPPGAVYKTMKFIRRHRVGVLAGVFMALALLAGLSLATIGFIESRKEAAKASLVKTFLQEMLASVGPHQARGRDVTVHYILEEASRRIAEGELNEHPEVEADVRMTIGHTYSVMGLYDLAEPHLRKAESIRSRRLGLEDPDTLFSRSALAELFILQTKYAESENLYRNTLQAQRRILGEEHPDTLTSMNGLGTALWELKRFEESESVLRRALEIQCRVFGDEHINTMGMLADLGSALMGQGKVVEAEKNLRSALKICRRVHGNDHPDTLKAENNLGVALQMQGRLKEAEKLYLHAFEVSNRILGFEHPQNQIALSNVISVIQAQVLRGQEPSGAHGLEETDSALDFQQKSIELPDDATAYNILAWNLLTREPEELRDPEAAVRAALKSNELSNWSAPDCLDTLALAYRSSGNLEKAVETQTRAVILSYSHPTENGLIMKLRLLEFLLEKMDPSGIGPVYITRVMHRFKDVPFPLIELDEVLSLLGYAYWAEDNIEPWKTFLRDCLAIQEEPLPGWHCFFAEAFVNLADALCEKKKYSEAESLFFEGLKVMDQLPREEQSGRHRAMTKIVGFYEAWGKKDEASRWRKKLNESTVEN